MGSFLGPGVGEPVISGFGGDVYDYEIKFGYVC
jgi:hypothetical protein